MRILGALKWAHFYPMWTREKKTRASDWGLGTGAGTGDRRSLDTPLGLALTGLVQT